MKAAESSAPNALLTPTEVAKLLMVSPITVRQWAQKGDLSAMMTPGGHRRFRREDLVRFARSRGLTLAVPDDSTTRLLIVDDDVAFAGYLESYFATLNQSVTTTVAHDGFDAGRKVQTFQPHIILLDLMMPGLNGFEVCQRIKSDPTSKAIRVIAMTGYASAANESRIRRAGAEQCLAKPFSQIELLDALGLEESRNAQPTSS